MLVFEYPRSPKFRFFVQSFYSLIFNAPFAWLAAQEQHFEMGAEADCKKGRRADWSRYRCKTFGPSNGQKRKDSLVSIYLIEEERIALETKENNTVVSRRDTRLARLDKFSTTRPNHLFHISFLSFCKF